MSLLGWIPANVRWFQDGPVIDWCYMGGQHFTEPFFEETINRVYNRPFNLLFRRETRLDALRDFAVQSPGLPPAGFVFHMSRCGSTLVARMLGAHAENLVLSEPSPLDAMLRIEQRYGGVADEHRALYFQWMISALTQPRTDAQQRVFVKFDSWSMQDLPIVRQVFPDVPWVFLYRDPVEVMVGTMKRSSFGTIAGPLSQRITGVPVQQLNAMPAAEVAARVLGKLCEMAATFHQHSPALLMNYSELPEAVPARLGPHFQLHWNETDLDTMKQTSRFNAKKPDAQFASDSVQKREAATEQIRDAVAQWITPHYQQLEKLRSYQMLSTTTTS